MRSVRSRWPLLAVYPSIKVASVDYLCRRNNSFINQYVGVTVCIDSLRICPVPAPRTTRGTSFPEPNPTSAMIFRCITIRNLLCIMWFRNLPLAIPSRRGIIKGFDPLNILNRQLNPIQYLAMLLWLIPSISTAEPATLLFLLHHKKGTGRQIANLKCIRLVEAITRHS
jgi:hypothetical protein